MYSCASSIMHMTRIEIGAIFVLHPGLVFNKVFCKNSRGKAAQQTNTVETKPMSAPQQRHLPPTTKCEKTFSDQHTIEGSLSVRALMEDSIMLD